MEVEIKGDTKKFKRFSSSIIDMTKEIIEEYNLSDVTRIVLAESTYDIIIVIFRMLIFR